MQTCQQCDIQIDERVNRYVTAKCELHYDGGIAMVFYQFHVGCFFVFAGKHRGAFESIIGEDALSMIKQSEYILRDVTPKETKTSKRRYPMVTENVPSCGPAR